MNNFYYPRAGLSIPWEGVSHPSLVVSLLLNFLKLGQESERLPSNFWLSSRAVCFTLYVKSATKSQQRMNSAYYPHPGTSYPLNFGKFRGKLMAGWDPPSRLATRDCQESQKIFNSEDSGGKARAKL